MNFAVLPTCILSGVLAVAGYMKKKKAAYLHQSGIKAEGDVISVTERNDINSNNRQVTYYYPVIRFKTAEGQLITKDSTIGSNPPRYNEGDKVPVIYNPADTTDFIVDDKSVKMNDRMFWFGIALIFIGVVLFLFLPAKHGHN